MQPWGYIVLVGAVCIVYALIMPARSVKAKQQEQQSLKETEAALELYMADIERENQELVQLVSSIKQQSQSNQKALEEQIHALSAALAEQQDTAQKLELRIQAGEEEVRQLAALAAKQVFVPAGEAGTEELPAVPAKPVSSMKLRYPRLFELHEEGKSIDAIAQAAGLQRGEVQLILQLAKQEESV